VRRTNRKYIVWLKEMLRQYFRNCTHWCRLAIEPRGRVRL
jgi:hypothetical protein